MYLYCWKQVHRENTVVQLSHSSHVAEWKCYLKVLSAGSVITAGILSSRCFCWTQHFTAFQTLKMEILQGWALMYEQNHG